MSAPNPHLHDIVLQLDRYGMAIRGVLPSPWSAGYHYTVGLLGHGHPEVCAFGLEPALACTLLDEVHLRVHDGEALVADRRARVDLDAAHGLAVVGVPRADVLGDGAALAHIDLWYGTVGYPTVGDQLAVQLVLPDLDGSLPWERPPEAHPRQPVLADGDPIRWGLRPPGWRHPDCPGCAGEAAAS